MPWVRAWGLAHRAALHRSAGDRGAACRALGRAITLFDSCEMGSAAEAGRYCLARLEGRGDDEARAHEALARRGYRAPGRSAEMLLPGLG